VLLGTGNVPPMPTDERPRHEPWLVLMKGSPGTGKSVVARTLGARLGWPVIDKDDVRDRLPDELGGLSYEAMLAVARTQLQIGLSVIADSPLGYARSYRLALQIARDCRARAAVIETVCSNPSEWASRITSRAGTGLAAHHAIA
jgi:predicted kinase